MINNMQEQQFYLVINEIMIAPGFEFSKSSAQPKSNTHEETTYHEAA